MGNSGANGLQVEVQKVAMPASSELFQLADKRSPIVDSYAYGLTTSSYLNYREGGRIKVSDQLNHHRANLMKVVFVGDSVQVIEPEVDLLSFFQKEDCKYGRIYTIVQSDLFEEELKCGDVIRAGKSEFLVREIVDGRDRVRYKGSNRSIKLEEDSILDGSVFNLDDEQAYNQNRAVSCMTCREKSATGKSNNPLIYPCANPEVCYCQRCLNKFIKENTKIKYLSSGVLQFHVSNLFDSKSGAEFARFVSGDSGTTHEILSYKQFFSSNHALILEKVQFTAKKGEVEGLILLYDSDSSSLPEGEPALFGTSAKCQIKLDDPTIEPVHFAITMNESKYFISDSKSRQYTYLRKQSKNKFDLLKNSETFCIHDHIITLTKVKEDQAATSPDNRCSRFDLYEHRGHSEAEKYESDIFEEKFLSNSSSENSNKLNFSRHADMIEENQAIVEPLPADGEITSRGPQSKVGIGNSYLRPLSKKHLTSKNQITISE